MFLADKLQRLIDEFTVLDDPQERLSAVVERAKRIPPLAPHQRIDSNRVRGCVSVVWITAAVSAGKCVFQGDAESPVVRGLVLLLCDFFTGASAAEVASSDLNPLDALDLARNLSPTRRHGLAAARQAVRDFAVGALRESNGSRRD